VPVNRGLVFWGVALVTAGAVALVVELNWVSTEFLPDTFDLWPMLLIVVGIALLASRTAFGVVGVAVAGLAVGALAGLLIGGTGLDIGNLGGCDEEPDAASAYEGTFGRSANVEIEFSCGRLEVSTQPGSGWTLAARHDADTEPNVDARADSLRLETEGRFLGLGGSRNEWELSLPTDGELELQVSANAAGSGIDLSNTAISTLELDVNAGDSVLTLSGASVDDLQVSGNAGSVSLIVDAATEATGEVSVNAGSLELCAADDASMAITLESEGNVTFSHNLDDSGLAREGDTWRTAAALGRPAISISVSGNAGSFNLNPEDGCA
jgi:Domain of unknown function (DUF5668)/Putative adhesin